MAWLLPGGWARMPSRAAAQSCCDQHPKEHNVLASVDPMVEPRMTFITPGVAAVGIKATGSVASALIGRYRPTGVSPTVQGGRRRCAAHGRVPAGRGEGEEARVSGRPAACKRCGRLA